MRKSKAPIGVAGEYFVAAELARRGHIALLTIRNTESVDILAASADGARRVSLQVKTRAGSARAWPLREKAERTGKAGYFYVFVSLGAEHERPEYFVVPSKVVARTIAGSHAKWLEALGRGGRKHRDNPMRKFRDCEGYRDRWDLLGL